MMSGLSAAAAKGQWHRVGFGWPMLFRVAYCCSLGMRDLVGFANGIRQVDEGAVLSSQRVRIEPPLNAAHVEALVAH